MSIFSDALRTATNFLVTEVAPVRQELIKAGLLAPMEPRGYEPKTNLTDPYNYNQSAYGYKERFSYLDYPKLRTIASTDPVISAILQTRVNQVAAFASPQTNKYKIGFKIAMRDKKKHGSKVVHKAAHEIQQFMMNCGFPESIEDAQDRKKRDSFDQFLRKITRDTLTFDQMNFEVVPRRNGIPAEFLAVDAATVRLVADKRDLDEQSGRGDSQPMQFADVMPQAPKKDAFKAEHPKLCQVVRGVIHNVYDEWEMAFGVRNPRSDILANGYGFSEIEMLVSTISAHLNAETYNRKFFSQGSAIKGVLVFEGAVPPDQLENFRRQWHQQVSGVNNAWKTPIMAMGKDSKLNWQSMHSTNREMEWGKYMEYLIKSICGVFQIDPIEIGFDISKNGMGQSGGSSGLGQGFAWDRLQYSMDKGLAPLLRFIQHQINEYIVWRINPDFEFEFVGLDARDEKDDMEIEQQQVKTFKTINELRAEHDMPALPEADDIKSVGDILLDPTFFQAVTGLSQEAKQQAQMQAMGGGPGGGGGPPGAGGDDQGGMPEEQEPDYSNMSTEDLQKEMSKLQGGGDQGGGQPPGQDQGGGGQPAPAPGGKPEQKRANLSAVKSLGKMELML